jgi:methionine-rich copper-binding protein CopC
MSQGSRKLVFRLFAAVTCGVIIAAANATAASAHAALTGTDPEGGSTVASAPESVSATFSEILDGPSTEIAVTDPNGETLDVPEAVFDGDTFTQQMVYTVPGEYTVAFRVISEDGHRVDDSLVFTVEAVPEELLAEGAAPEETGEPAEPETAEETEAPGEAAPTEAAADDEDSDTGASLAMILLGVLVVVVGGVVMVKLLGHKTKRE